MLATQMLAILMIIPRLIADIELIATKRNQEGSGQVSNNGLLFVACEEELNLVGNC
jgi:hypothetical protein